MRRKLLYSLLALVLGVSLTLIPLFTIGFEDKDYNALPEVALGFREESRGVSEAVATQHLFLSMEIFAASFVAALAVYLFVRHRLLH